MDFITEYLDAARETVLKWILNRDMPAHKVGRQWKFKITEVDEWIRSGGAADKPGASD
jgi:excisionase family DNA binding protein